MRKLSPLLLFALTAVALPLYAAKGRDQSYITFDDGGTIVRQGDDNREVEARVNFPIYPGDEVTTNRRGRTEIRLADGNILALDRSTSVRFRSIYDSYETEATQSIVELKFGHVAVQRADDATELLRIDTPNASYAATDQAVYSVEADTSGRDRVTVYDGYVEVRTPQRSTRIARGEEARVDDQGLYGLVNSSNGVADEFERWFLRRSERYGNSSSRYLDRSLAYADYDLQENGSWVYVSNYGGYAWRPRVAVGWRPYYNGRWGYGVGGCLTWISYEPWGWVPYHYGRWGYDPFYGWIWLPGYTYAPAWVYWAYGPGYIGWAPAGWYDCYRPYYNWAYRPYSRAGYDWGAGFYGRVRLNEVDLRPWTFVSPNGIVSNRVDQAALTTDAVRQRIIRDPNGSLATVTGTPARFSRSDLRDPASAITNIVRRGPVGGTGREGSGTAADMTPFFRRDPELSSTVRDRIVRSRVPEASAGIIGGGSGGSIIGSPSGVPTPGTRGTLEGRSDRDGSTSKGDYRPAEGTGRVFRDPYAGSSTRHDDRAPVTERGSGSANSGSGWRDHVDRTPVNRGGDTRTGDAPSTVDRSPASTQDNWRGRTVDRGGSREAAPRGSAPSSDQRGTVDRGADIPRRIIDRIGGARIYSGDSPRETPSRDTYSPRNDPPRQASPRNDPPRQTQTSSPPPPPRQERSSPPPSKSQDGGGTGRVKRGD
jgi:hypothetical protein